MLSLPIRQRGYGAAAPGPKGRCVGVPAEVVAARVREGTPVTDQFDMTLTDVELLAELELSADLMVAANASDGPLSPETIDRILQGHPVDDEPGRVPPGIPPPRRPG